MRIPSSGSGDHGGVTSEELTAAVCLLIDLDDRGRADEAAAALPDRMVVADLLRAGDGLQRLARSLASLRRSTSHDTGPAEEYDPHDVRSLYS